MEFGKNDSYEALICDLSQVKQGILENVKNYTARVQGLSVRITRSLRVQGYGADNPIFKGIKALVIKYFLIGLVPELLQQVKYEGLDILEEVIRIAEKKEASLESTLIMPPKDTANIQHTPLRASFSTNTLHSSNTPSKMEVVMEQLVSQMTQISVHLLQPQTFCNTKRDSNKVQCFACKKMDHISRNCPNRDAMGSFIETNYFYG